MSTVESPVTIVINRLALGPTAPDAGSPLLTRVAEVVAQMGPAPWSKRIIADERNLVTLIASPPGGGNRPHWHREFDEWWVVLQGEIDWYIEDEPAPIRARGGDFVLGPKKLPEVGRQLALVRRLRRAPHGWVPGGGGTQLLPRLIGWGRTRRILMTGETFGAEGLSPAGSYVTDARADEET